MVVVVVVVIGDLGCGERSSDQNRRSKSNNGQNKNRIGEDRQVSE